MKWMNPEWTPKENENFQMLIEQNTHANHNNHNQNENWNLNKKHH